MQSVTFYLPLLLIFLPVIASANNYGVKAEVTDSVGDPEPYVTWRIFTADSAATQITGAVTDASGKIDATLSQCGDYKLVLQSMTGANLDMPFSVSDDEPVANLGILTLLSGNSQLLEGITVTAQKPLVVKEIDRIGYDVQADPEASTAPLIDILRKVPMVTVDGDGNITVNGTSDFKIYKNGRPNNSFTKNAKDLFKAIPASSIKKIEVITDPGAREDAEGVGAILNIVTDSDSSLEGITGTVNLYFDTNNPVPTPRLWLSCQINKVTFSLYGNYYNFNRRESENTATSKSTYNDINRTLIYDDKSSGRRNAYSGGFELSYELDTLNLFTASLDMYQNFSKSDVCRNYRMTDFDGNILQRYTQTSYYPKSRFLDIDGNFNYQRSTRLKGENITLSYRISTTGQKQVQQTDYTDMFNFPASYSGIRSNFDLRFIEHTAQLDWTRPIAGRHTLDIGSKYIARRNHSKNFRDYIGSVQTFDDFKHNTDIAAAYADFRAKFGKFGIRGGFRYEYSRLAAKFVQGNGSDFSSTINDYVPNATVTYNLNDANTFKITYNRRISRPGIPYLDPTVSSSPQSTISGNPHLRSTNFDNISANYSLIKAKFNLDFTLRYSFSDNALAETMDLVGDHIYYSFGNVGKYRQFNTSLYAQWSPSDKTTLQTNIYIAVIHYEVTDGSSKTGPIYNPYISWQQKLPYHFRLRTNIGWWSGGINSAYTHMTPSIAYFWNNFNIQRYFLSDDRLSVGLSLQNPFGPYKRKSTNITERPGYYQEYKSTSPHNFSVGLTASYRFGSLKASVKKTAASIDNDDLQGRKN